MGLNEFAGYFAVAGSALATGYVAAHFGLRPEPFYLGVAFVALSLALSVLAVRETKGHAAVEGNSRARSRLRASRRSAKSSGARRLLHGRPRHRRSAQGC
jgi:hypothetical protein